MSQTLRTAQPLLEEKQLMLISAMAQQSCFTARSYFVQPQLMHSCCACWRWVPAAAQVLTPCSDPSGPEPRTGSRGRDKSGKNLTWAVTQLESCAEDKLSSSCGCFPVQATWTLAVQTHCCPQAELQHLGDGGEPQTTPLPSYWNFTGTKRHLIEGSQALDEASAHPCLSGSQISWCFPAGKTEHWSSHGQNCSGNPAADSWCFCSPCDTLKYNGMLLWTSQIPKILVIWIFITTILSCQNTGFCTRKTIHLT